MTRETVSSGLLYRLERANEGKVRWFEAMLLVDAANRDGRWLPTRFQVLQSGSLPKPGVLAYIVEELPSAMKLARLTENVNRAE